MPDGAIPHGLKGYREPYECRCAICKAGWAEYIRKNRADRKARNAAAASTTDELARKRGQRGPDKSPRKPKGQPKTESSDSEPQPPTIGLMEQAVIDECAALKEPAKATQLVAARSLASLIDRLNLEAGGAAVVNSATKQLMALMAEIRGDATKSGATGRRKSGGRLATVGEMTKVKRRGA